MDKYYQNSPAFSNLNKISNISFKLKKYNEGKRIKRNSKFNKEIEHNKNVSNLYAYDIDLSPKVSKYNMKKRHNLLSNSPLSSKTTKTNVLMRRNIKLYPENKNNTLYTHNLDTLNSYKDKLNSSLNASQSRIRMNKSSKNFYPVSKNDIINHNRNITKINDINSLNSKYNNHLKRNNLLIDSFEGFDNSYNRNLTLKNKHFGNTKSTEATNRHLVNNSNINRLNMNNYIINNKIDDIYLNHYNSEHFKNMIYKDNLPELINGLIERNNELEKKLSEALNYNTNLMEEKNINFLKQKIQELNAQNLNLNKKIKLVINNTNYLQIQKIMKENIYFKNESKALIKRLNEVMNEKNEIESKANELVNHLNTLINENDKLKEELEKNYSNSNIYKTSDIYNNSINNIDNEDSFNDKRNSLYEQQNLFLKEIENLKNINNKLMKEKSAVEENNNNLKKQVFNLMKNKENNKDKYEKEYKNTKDNPNLLNKIKELERNNNELKTQNEILKVKINSKKVLLNRNNIYKEEQNEIFNNLESNRDNLEIQNQSLKTKLRMNYEKENDDINGDYKKLKLVNESLSKKNKELYDKTIDLTKNINEYKSKYEMLLSEKNDNDKLLKEMERLKLLKEEQNKNDIKDEEIKKLREKLKEIDKKNLELNNTKNEIKNLKEELEKIKVELENQVSKNISYEKDIEKYKEINSKILEENSRKQEQISNYENNINNNEIKDLKKIIENREKEIEELKKELEKYKNKKNNLDTSYSGTNKKDSSFGNEGEYISSNFDSHKISDAQKVEKLKERVNEYKNKFELNENLLKLLKEEIKELKKKLTDFETFGGKITDYNEFIRAFNILLKDYKPKKKEQKEALSQLRNHLKKELD